MDGASGAIYAIFLNALTSSLRAQSQEYSSIIPVSIDMWTQALEYAIVALQRHTPAKVGDRTMMDALIPFCKSLTKARSTNIAAAAAQAGAESTKHRKASLERTVYVGDEYEWIGETPDPGAYGLNKLLMGLVEAL